MAGGWLTSLRAASRLAGASGSNFGFTHTLAVQEAADPCA
jgi:hypothetical protein